MKKEVKEVIHKLRRDAEFLSGKLTEGDSELMQMLDDWFDVVTKIQQLENYENMVAVNGGQHLLVQDFIDDKCIILLPERRYKDMSMSFKDSE